MQRVSEPQQRPRPIGSVVAELDQDHMEHRKKEPTKRSVWEHGMRSAIGERAGRGRSNGSHCFFL